MRDVGELDMARELAVLKWDRPFKRQEELQGAASKLEAERDRLKAAKQPSNYKELAKGNHEEALKCRNVAARFAALKAFEALAAERARTTARDALAEAVSSGADIGRLSEAIANAERCGLAEAEMREARAALRVLQQEAEAEAERQREADAEARAQAAEAAKWSHLSKAEKGEKVYDLCHQSSLSREQVDEVRSLLKAGAGPDDYKVSQ